MSIGPSFPARTWVSPTSTDYPKRATCRLIGTWPLGREACNGHWLDWTDSRQILGLGLQVSTLGVLVPAGVLGMSAVLIGELSLPSGPPARAVWTSQCSHSQIMTFAAVAAAISVSPSPFPSHPRRPPARRACVPPFRPPSMRSALQHLLCTAASSYHHTSHDHDRHWSSGSLA